MEKYDICKLKIEVPIKKIKKYYAVQILEAIESYLKYEPEKQIFSRIKKLRGYKQIIFRLRVGEYRIFYDVKEVTVTILTILPKSETQKFYQQEKDNENSNSF